MLESEKLKTVMDRYLFFLSNIIKLRIQLMQLKKLIFLLITLAFLLPTTVNASDIDVKAGNVRVRTEQDGPISVNTGRNRVEVDKYNNRPVPWWQPWNYWNRHRSNRNCRSSTYQRSTQTTRTNGHVQRSSISTNTCR